MDGDIVSHDEAILNSVMKCMDTSDVIVLAQASMAIAVDSLSARDKEKVLTSPLLGIRKIKRDLYNKIGG